MTLDWTQALGDSVARLQTLEPLAPCPNGRFGLFPEFSAAFNHARRSTSQRIWRHSKQPTITHHSTPSVKSFSSEALPPHCTLLHRPYPYLPLTPPPYPLRCHHNPCANPWNSSKLSENVGRWLGLWHTKCGDRKAHPARVTTTEEEHALILDHRLSPGTRVSTSSPTRSRTALHRKSDTTLYAQLPIRYAANTILTNIRTVPLSASAPSADSSASPQSRSRSPTSRTPSARCPASPAAH